MDKIGKAFVEAGDDEYEDDVDFDAEDAGEIAATVAIKSGKSILAVAAEQVKAEARVEWESNLNEAGEAAAMQFDGMGDRASAALSVMNKALDDCDDDSSDDEMFERDPEANSALRIACYRGEFRTVEKLLGSGGGHARARDRHGWTALHWASKSGDSACIDLLVSAVKSENDGKVTSFLNSADSLSGWTALHVACMNGKKDAVKALIHHGANCAKLTKFKEIPADCISQSARNGKQLRRLLGVIDEKDNQRDEGKEEEGKDAGDEKR